MTRAGRRLRLGVAAVVLGALALGTLWGDDDHFPFGPFRMYASTHPADGATTWFELIGVTAAGEHVVLGDGSYGMRRAELEARVGWYGEDPSRLAALADAYAERHPGEPRLVALELVERRQDRGADAPGSRVVARWVRP